MKINVIGACIVVASLLLGSGAVFAQLAGGDDSSAQALVIVLEVERELLREDTQHYDRLSIRRTRSLAELNDLYRSLDLAVKRTDEGGPDLVRELMEQIEGAERERASLIDSERDLVDGIRERIRKIGLLEDRFAALQESDKATRGVVTGSWDVTLLPINQRGRFEIRQTGTLLSGTYTLQGGFSGSLQGTLVNRKVYLVRIDSKLGRKMEFEGYLSADKKRLRGSWLDYELSGENGATGEWSAVRVEADD